MTSSCKVQNLQKPFPHPVRLPDVPALLQILNLCTAVTGAGGIYMRAWPVPGFRGTEEERFWSKVRIAESGCWEWQGKKWEGYGTFCLQRKPGQKNNSHVKAHRWSYEYCIGPIPEGLEPDHTCRNPACVNPAHIEPVLPIVNKYRGNSPCTLHAMKVFCIRGHKNWHFRTDGGRECIDCKRWRNALRYNPTAQP